MTNPIPTLANYAPAFTTQKTESDEKLFLKQQKRFIAAVSIMEQYEVDYQKNSLRAKDGKEVKENTSMS